jgi:hypothetical protein
MSTLLPHRQSLRPEPHNSQTDYWSGQKPMSQTCAVAKRHDIASRGGLAVDPGRGPTPGESRRAKVYAGKDQLTGRKIRFRKTRPSC